MFNGHGTRNFTCIVSTHAVSNSKQVLFCDVRVFVLTPQIARIGGSTDSKSQHGTNRQLRLLEVQLQRSKRNQLSITQQCWFSD